MVLMSLRQNSGVPHFRLADIGNGCFKMKSSLLHGCRLNGGYFLTYILYAEGCMSYFMTNLPIKGFNLDLSVINTLREFSLSQLKRASNSKTVIRPR